MTATEVSNFRVPKGRTLVVRGKAHPTGQVLPEWYVDWDGGLESRINDGHLVPTLDAVTEKDLTPPAPKTENDQTPLMAKELNRLTGENLTLRDLVKEHEKARSEYDRARVAKDRQLGDQTVELDRLREGLAQAQKRCEELTGEVETLTARATAAEAEAAKLKVAQPKIVATSGKKPEPAKPEVPAG